MLPCQPFLYIFQIQTLQVILFLRSLERQLWSIPFQTDPTLWSLSHYEYRIFLAFRDLVEKIFLLLLISVVTYVFIYEFLITATPTDESVTTPSFTSTCYFLFQRDLVDKGHALVLLIQVSNVLYPARSFPMVTSTDSSMERAGSHGCTLKYLTVWNAGSFQSLMSQQPVIQAVDTWLRWMHSASPSWLRAGRTGSLFQ